MVNLCQGLMMTAMASLISKILLAGFAAMALWTMTPPTRGQRSVTMESRAAVPLIIVFTDTMAVVHRVHLR